MSISCELSESLRPCCFGSREEMLKERLTELLRPAVVGSPTRFTALPFVTGAGIGAVARASFAGAGGGGESWMGGPKGAEADLSLSLDGKVNLLGEPLVRRLITLVKDNRALLRLDVLEGVEGACRVDRGGRMCIGETSGGDARAAAPASVS